MTTELRPFRIDVTPSDLEDLHHRLAATRWPSQLAGDGWDRGIPVDHVRDLAAYWRDHFDWRAQEARLNRFPQLVTEIDGQPVHLVHVRSADPDALPLLLTHGYPSSFVEFEQLLERLSDFHLVIPTLPGFGYSTPVRETGWTMARIARAWVELMARLGYSRYGVHGSDVGAGVSGLVAGYDSEHVVGVHLVTDPSTAAASASFLPGLADGLDEADPVDRLIRERIARYRDEDSGYLAISSTRPQTIAYGLTDSPAAQLAWIAECFERWSDMPVDRDRLLTNVSLYWFTGSAVTAAGLLHEQAHSSEWGAPSAVPTGYSVFGADPTVRRIMRPAEGAYWVEHERGGHFPALEAPDLLAGDLRSFFGSL